MISNTTISKGLPFLLMVMALFLLLQLYRGSAERDRLAAGIFLTIVFVICLEVVLLDPH